MAISTYKVFLMKKADTGEQWMLEIGRASCRERV